MSDPRPSKVATALLNASIAAPRSLRQRVLAKGARRARRLVLAKIDPIVEYTLGGRRVHLPLSHELPAIVAVYPDYGANLVRLVETVVAEKGPRGFIDIGANVGDTIVLVRAGTDVPALAIEGDDRYASLLYANVADISDVEVEASYVSSKLTAGPVQVIRTIGTASLVPSASKSPVTLRTLAEIVADHRRFADAGVVKLDTDGADAAIIVANAEWFAAVKPVIFLEYDGTSAAMLGDPEPWRAFDVLAHAGYRRAVVYVNTGELLMEAAACDTTTWKDLAKYTTLAGRDDYFDVALFADEDTELANRFLAAERARFA